MIKKSKVFFFLFIIFSHQLIAQEWGTVFPTDKAIVEMDKAYSGQRIVVENHYYPKPGKFDEVLALRIEASELRRKLGFTPGRILVNRQTMDRANDKQEEVAAIIWHSEFENLETLKKELNSYTREQEKLQKKIQDKMGLLINRFKRTSSYVVFN